MTTDRLTFLAEWKDSLSSVNWKFHLFFYPSDDTIEMYDLLKHRLFLKRTKCEDLRMEDLFIGATLRICSRLISIKDYADSYTRSKVETCSQKTCILLKPEIGNKKGQIFTEVLNNHFKLINIKMIQLTDLQANELLKENEDESILKSSIEHVTSGPVVVCELLGVNAVYRCLDLVGPENPEEAREKHPKSLRARFGIDKIRNGIFVSASPESVERDSKILFDPKCYTCLYLYSFSSQNFTTCCVIKPHAVKAGHVGQIINMIEEFGYEITGICMCILSIEQAEKFHEIYKYVLPEYQEMVQELCSGPCVAMEIGNQTKGEMFSEFRKLVGPLDVEIAKVIRPHTIRARFGKTKIQNSVHVTDLIEDVFKEIRFFFKTVMLNCSSNER